MENHLIVGNSVKSKTSTIISDKKTENAPPSQTQNALKTIAILGLDKSKVNKLHVVAIEKACDGV